MHPGQSLRRGEELINSNGKYRAVMQHDGNFVLYDSRALWASNTVRRGTHVIMHIDGNLVVYDGSEPTWASNTQFRGYELVCQDDGNLVIYNFEGKSEWSSNTHNQY